MIRDTVFRNIFLLFVIILHLLDPIQTIIMKLICLATTLAATSAFAPSVHKAATPATTSGTALYGEFGASSTSFYTTTEKQDTYASLEEILDEKCKDKKVQQVIIDMLEVCADITEALRTALVTVEGSMNDFGDAQLSVDVSYSFSILNR